jgi:hypothetical protein
VIVTSLEIIVDNAPSMAYFAIDDSLFTLVETILEEIKTSS